MAYAKQLIYPKITLEEAYYICIKNSLKSVTIEQLIIPDSSFDIRVDNIRNIIP